MMTLRYVLGVDAGGTKTEAVVIDPLATGDQVIGWGRSGPGNVRAVGPEAACAALTAACSQALAESGVPPDQVAAVCVAAAGAGRQQERAILQQWAETITRQSVVTHDADAVLAAGCAGRIGVALISGTGSLAYGRNAAGECSRAGGWGYWIGDEGSGYAVGRAALQAVAQAHDGRGPATTLTNAVCQLLGIAGPEQLVAAVYGALRRAPMSEPNSELDGPLTPRKLARLAPLVDACAAEGDAAAWLIVKQAASDLASMVHAVQQKLTLPADAPLALAGGVLTGSSLIRDQLLESLRDRGLSPTVVSVVQHPAVGAARIAVEALNQSSS